MRDVLPALLAAYARGEPVALATLVRTWNSAPRPPGSLLLVTEQGGVAGSVSGGCVEGDLFEVGRQVLATGQPVVVSYGVSDEDAFAAGLTCGGSLEAFVQRVSPESWPGLPAVAASIQAGEPVAVATVVRGPAHVGRRLVVRGGAVEGSMGDPRLDSSVVAEVLGLPVTVETRWLSCRPEGERAGASFEVFVASYAPPRSLVVFGATDVAGALCRAARPLGYRTTVVDARPVFATPERLPDADEVVVDWPDRWLGAHPVDERTAICVLTHDPKFDLPALAAAVRTPAAFIGAMGSRRTHADRVARLVEAGVSDDEIARIHSPIGLDLGARTPDEIALSIAAQLVQVRRGGSGAPLSGGAGRLHAGDGP
jgi:xanthine dehydrogenase accessory factor